MGAKTPRTSDRRVQKTHRALREALIALITERGWDGFGVQELCERADVGRSTFYLHFADKEDLLDGGLAELRSGMRAQVAAQDAPRRPLAFARPMIEHAWENRRAFHALLGDRAGQPVLRRFRDLILELASDDLAGASGPVRKKAAARLLAGGFLELLAWGIGPDGVTDPAELESLFLELAAPVLGALARP